MLSGHCAADPTECCSRVCLPTLPLYPAACSCSDPEFAGDRPRVAHHRTESHRDRPLACTHPTPPHPTPPHPTPPHPTPPLALPHGMHSLMHVHALCCAVHLPHSPAVPALRRRAPPRPPVVSPLRPNRRGRPVRPSCRRARRKFCMSSASRWRTSRARATLWCCACGRWCRGARASCSRARSSTRRARPTQRCATVRLTHRPAAVVSAE